MDFSVAVQGDDGTWVPDIAWADVPADASGGAEVDYIVPESWAGKTLQLTVMGLSSSLMAQTTFTDSVTSVTVTAVNGVPVASLPITITSLPASLTVDFNYVTSRTGTTTGDLDLLTTPTVISNTGVSLTPGTQSGSIMLTIPSGTANQTANVKVTVHNNTGSGANQKNDVVPQAVTIAVPTPSATPTPTATPTATPCQNQAPVIACLTPTTDLGTVVGCLGTGTGFGQTFPVSYAVVDGSGNSKIVQATFTLPDSTTVGPVNVASVTDADAGDAITVTLSNETTSVTISGPGSGSAPYQLDIHADDGQACNNIADATCGGTATATIAYDFHGFFPPLDGQRNTKVKRGSGVPVKFQIFDCSGTPISPANFPGDPTMFPAINVTKLSGITPVGLDIDDAGFSGDDGFLFRWDPTDMQWIFNLKTNSTYDIGCTYLIWANLGDDVDHNVPIAIK